MRRASQEGAHRPLPSTYRHTAISDDDRTRLQVAGSDTIRHAGDGIHFEFSDQNVIGKNTVTGSRYVLHFMYADDNKIIGNTFRDNLSGAVLMYSKELILKDNDLSANRRGASGAGLLLKDDDNIWVEGNRILRNKFGMMVDGTPQSAGSTAIFRRNLFALNDTGIAVMSNAPITLRRKRHGRQHRAGEGVDDLARFAPGNRYVVNLNGSAPAAFL